MDGNDIARALVARLCATHGEQSRVGQALLAWASDHAAALWPEKAGKRTKRSVTDWDAFTRRIEKMSVSSGAVETAIGNLADVLSIEPMERHLLLALVLLRRVHALSNLRTRLVGAGCNIAEAAACAAGFPENSASGALANSVVMRIGLVRLQLATGGGVDVEIDWLLTRLLDQGLADADAMVALLVGVPQATSLEPADFSEQATALDLLIRLMRGTIGDREPGVNVLLYGPPGTGKTEFARVLAKVAGAPLYAVGESDDYGEEPSRFDRLTALRRAQHVFKQRGNALLLFDEMEDLIGDAAAVQNSDAMTGRMGSKLFVNRMLETNPVPVIWTSNAIDNVDPAHLRRMSYVLRFDHPRPAARARIVSRLAAQEGVSLSDQDVADLAGQAEDAASVTRLALRAQRIARGTSADGRVTTESLLKGLRYGGPLAPNGPTRSIDLELIESDPPVPSLASAIADANSGDFSLLLTGPPGTGKTALAHRIADLIERPLIVRRASDILSKWVGGTEANIADAFSRARDKGAALLFDEVDSLLMNRADARHSWEITQVNELLTWMDDHPLPIIAATNFETRLDPAAMRRFVFKLRLNTLGPERASRAFEHFFDRAAPEALAAVRGLTPGDFAVVRRQLKFGGRRSNAAIIDALVREAASRPESGGRIGF